MTDTKKETEKSRGPIDRADRKFAVSTNRGKASHRVRYVEAGGAGVDMDECAFCEAMPDLSDATSDQDGKNRDGEKQEQGGG